MLAKTMSNAGKCVKIFSRRQLLEGTPTNSAEEGLQMLETIRQLFVLYSTNAYMLSENDRSTNFLTEKNIGAGLFPFMSLINHSCLPNMAIITVDNTSALITILPVKAGDQVRILEVNVGSCINSSGGTPIWACNIFLIFSSSFVVVCILWTAVQVRMLLFIS